MLRKAAVVAAIVVAVGVVASVALAFNGSHGGGRDLTAVRRATAQYRRVDVAEDAGYGLLADAQGITCIDMPGTGAMGTHYVNGALVGDGAVDPIHPEAMVYDVRNRIARLVAVEYIVPQALWDGAHSSPPSLFGQTFALTGDDNRFGIPAFYSLHAWVWKHNRAGTFEMWNPDVHCGRENAPVPYGPH